MSKLIPVLFMPTLLMGSIPNYLDMAVGYRNDTLHNHGISARDEDGHIVMDESLSQTGLNVFEVGGKVRYEPFCNIFGRGACYVGWANGNGFTENALISDEFFHSESHHSHGQTIDWDLEGGYQFNFCWFGVAPIFGWSYDYMDIRMKKTFTNAVADPFLSGLRYTSYWNGPFAAVDLYVNVWNFLINFGYEYHWCHWKGRYFLPIPSDKGRAFSNIRRSHNAFGNVFYLDFLWNFCGCWDLGASYKYFNYSTKGGDFSPYFGTFASQGFPEIISTDVPHAAWESHQATLDIRYSF